MLSVAAADTQIVYDYHYGLTPPTSETVCFPLRFCKHTPVVLPQAYLVKLSVDTQKRARFTAGSFVLLLTYILTIDD